MSYFFRGDSQQFLTLAGSKVRAALKLLCCLASYQEQSAIVALLICSFASRTRRLLERRPYVLSGPIFQVQPFLNKKPIFHPIKCRRSHAKPRNKAYYQSTQAYRHSNHLCLTQSLFKVVMLVWQSNQRSQSDGFENLYETAFVLEVKRKIAHCDRERQLLLVLRAVSVCYQQSSITFISRMSSKAFGFVPCHVRLCQKFSEKSLLLLPKFFLGLNKFIKDNPIERNECIVTNILKAQPLRYLSYQSFTQVVLGFINLLKFESRPVSYTNVRESQILDPSSGIRDAIDFSSP